MRRLAALTILLMLLAPGLSTGADTLFEGHEPLRVVVTAPVAKLTRSSPEVPGTLSWEGGDTELPLKISLRGRSRLRSCQYPPLRLNFKKSTVAGTPFAGQNKLKLVTRCRGKAKYQDYLELEYRIYRIFNLITDESLRVRWLEITFVDESRGGRVSRQSGFLIEDVGRAADRMGKREVKRPSIPIGDLAGRHATEVAIFNYFIGNTDWSVIAASGGENCCHNGKPLADPGRSDDVVVIPYDFDQAGLINAEYARPSRQLPIRSVRNRLYRGFCRFNDHVPDVLERFRQRRKAIENLIAEAQLSRAFRRGTESYIRVFYALTGDERAVQKHIFGKCRG